MSPNIRSNLEDYVKIGVAIFAIWALLNKVPSKDDLNTALDTKLAPFTLRMDVMDARINRYLAREVVEEAKESPTPKRKHPN